MANEMVNELEAKTFKNYKDNYEKILPIFTYTTLDEVKTVTPEMEKAYKKASAVVQYHSMLIRDVEYCNWIKNTFVVIGRTHFHKHDYFAGLEAFEYVVNKNKKHPYRFEAMMWMLRTYNETGLFSSSQGLIDLILDEKKFPPKYKSDFNAIVTDFYLKQEDYAKAIEFLEPAIKLCKKNKVKSRYSYVLAQLYQKQGDGDNAVKYFNKSLGLGVGYDMAFNAKLNLAKSKALSGGNPKQIKKMYLEMLSEQKYKDYQDQIYFSLAELAEKQNEIKDEEYYLVQSVKVSKANKNQKGLSSLKVGDLYFTQAKYEISQLYFDTAVNFLNKDFPDFYVVENKQKSLKTLVGYLKTIANEDSLQRVSKLSKNEQNALVDKLILEKRKKLEEEKQKLEEQKAILESNKAVLDNAPLPGGGGPFGGSPFGGGSAQWYFYNPAALSFGLSDFQKKFGNRKLEDNWRRSNKPIVANEEIIVGTDTSKAAKELAKQDKNETLTPEQLEEKEREKYFKNILNTPELISASTGKIVDAYYNSGTLYKEQLNDLNNASKTFESLLEKYPENKYKLVTYYQLYRIYLALPDDKKAAYYKDLITGKYPDSEYAAIINNPDINNQKLGSKNKEDVFYETTYNLYTANNYSGCTNNCIEADSLFPKSIYKAKYALLKALCIGNLEGAAAMIAALKQIVATYSKDPVKDRAAEIIAILEKNGSIKSAESEAKKSLFTKEEKEEHYFALQMPMTANLNLIKAALTTFCEDNFSTLQLNVTDMIFDENKKLVLVQGLENAKQAMNFYNIAKDNAAIVGTLQKDVIKQYVISKNNFTTLFKNQKELESYTTFFQENYLKI